MPNSDVGLSHFGNHSHELNFHIIRPSSESSHGGDKIALERIKSLKEFLTRHLAFRSDHDLESGLKLHHAVLSIQLLSREQPCLVVHVSFDTVQFGRHCPNRAPS
jgi:hypothetical protein